MMTTVRTAALAAGVALAISPVVAPTANAASSAATSAPVAARAAAAPRHDAPWERGVYAQLNAVRRQAKMRPVPADACLSKALLPLAERSARARRAVAVTAADRRRAQACFPRRGTDIETVWGPASTTPARWITAARRVSKTLVTKNRTTGGVAVYRGTDGRHYVALAQVTLK